MKLSDYNFFLQIDDQIILGYNSLTTALVELTAEEFAALQEYVAKPCEDFFMSRGVDAFRDNLLKVGILVPDGYEELEQIRAIHTALKEKAKRTLGLTIVPTLDCNFRCTYCFSYSRRERMNSGVQTELLRFIRERLPEDGRLSVTWYAGEPTLCLDLIETLSTHMRAACEDRGAECMPADIITNGFLLTEDVAKRLKAAGITQAQVTLDGDRATHDRQRPLQGGIGTFDRILENVFSARDILDLQIRVNINRSNIGTAVGALDALIEHGLQRLPVYFGHVKPYTEACSSIASDCLSDREFCDINLSLSREAIVRGFVSLRYPQLQLGGVCGAQHRLYYLVAPDGLLFKCWAQASLGPEHSIGSVSNDQITSIQETNLKRFLEWEPLDEKKCQGCRVLPICMGGCPYLRLNGSLDASCSPWRHSLLDTLALRYKMGHLFKKESQTAS